jgi:integrase/recombinase XerD
LRKQSAATINFKLSVIRSLYDYLKLAGQVAHNPALTKAVPPPALPEDQKGRALSPKEVNYLLHGPNRLTPEGGRDYALLLLMVRTSLRVSEACSLKTSLIKWSHGRWILRFKVKGGRERSIPLPEDLKKGIDDYLKLDRARRELLHSGGDNAFIFQPHTNYRTLKFNKGISTTMAWNIVRK